MAESLAKFALCPCGRHGCVVGSNGFSRLHDCTKEGALGTLADEGSHHYIYGEDVARVRQQITESGLPTVLDVEKIGFEEYWKQVSSCPRFPHRKGTFDQEMQFVIGGRV